MHRASFLVVLETYGRLNPEDHDRVETICDFVERHEDCFWRSCLEGHVTASSWIVSPDRSHFLLVHHRRLGRWLQPGGHADGETDTAAVALREAREESGLHGIRFLPVADRPLPFDVDVHSILATGSVPAHSHYDIRYLLEAETLGPLRVSFEEAHDVRWFGYDEVEEVLAEESLSRMARKAREILGMPE